MVGAKNKTQSAAILRLLIDAHGAWVPLPEIMACAAQYNARIFELRRLGFHVENRTEMVIGFRHSWFRLLTSPTVQAPEPAVPSSCSSDWYESATGQPRPVEPVADLGPLFQRVIHGNVRGRPESPLGDVKGSPALIKHGPR
jgi:hypothetical protein